MQVIKRDGRKVEFDINKIKEAIRKAYVEVYPDKPEINDQKISSVINIISNKINNFGFSEITIEQIQDIVEYPELYCWLSF